MFIPTIISLLTLGIVNVVVSDQINKCSSDDRECFAKQKESKYAEKTNKWRKYFEVIENALNEYQPCPYQNCSCFTTVADRDLEPWRNIGITREMLDQVKNSGSHYQIVNHKLYRGTECMFPARCNGIEHFLLEIVDTLPDVEFILNTRDWPQIPSWNQKQASPVFSFSKTTDYFDLMFPAWSFWEGGPAISLHPTGIGRWDQHRESISKAAENWPWEKKETKAFFRGSRTNAERDALVLLSRSKPDLVDAQFTKNQAWKSDKDTLGLPAANEISFEDHCHFKYLFNFRGVAASFRFKHLFLCKSLVLQVGDQWQEFFYPALKPWVHYVPVNADKFDQVEELLEFLRENDDVAKEIANRGFEFIWNHLTLEDVRCYWRYLLQNYAKLQKFNVELNPSLKSVK